MTNKEIEQARLKQSKSEELLKSISTRELTTLDDLTHNFIGDIGCREYFIEKYGQCFENGVRYT